VFFKSVSNRFRFAACTVVAALGFSAMPAPAQAQQVSIQHCYVPASGGNIVHSCGAVQIQLQVVADTNGCNPPWTCGWRTYYQVRARRNPDLHANVAIVSAQSQVFRTGKCYQAPPTTAWTSWCTLGSTMLAPPTLWMMSVTAPRL
jgi:hypothetical protein